MTTTTELTYTTLATPIGTLALATRDGRLREIALPAADGSPRPHDGWVHDADVLPAARAQLAAWFAGGLGAFDLELDTDDLGSPFQRDVWAALDGIGYGETLTYGSLAALLGRPGAVRAVGGACGANPLPIVRPCHRVLAASGLGGFAGGLTQKRWLLAHERPDGIGATDLLAARAG